MRLGERSAGGTLIRNNTHLRLTLAIAAVCIAVIALACLGLGAWQRNSWRAHEQIQHIPPGTTAPEVIRRAGRPPAQILTTARGLRQTAGAWGCTAVPSWDAGVRRAFMYTHFDHPDLYFLYFDADDRLLRIVSCRRRGR